MQIQCVALRNVRFYANHGFYAEEQIIGNEFFVDLMVRFIPDEDSENLAKTVNYEVLNTIIHKQMSSTQKLLETVIKNILNEVLVQFPFVQYIKVTVRKTKPPMPGEIAYSEVSLEYSADEKL